ncbi:3-oxoacyl-reductase [Coniochaeta sp. 2T2.1]|nr:3-oxoacyl-reductase [Coniochaeta sp. 2T2.1]
MTLAGEKNVWFITGCSSGFGRAISLAVLERGDIVVATARDKSTIQHLAEKGAITYALDVTADDATLKTIVDSVIAETGKINILVNNAGYVLGGGVEECSRDQVSATFDTNVFGQLNVLRAVLPHIRREKKGAVAFMGSTSSHRGVPGGGLYSATKAACSVLAEALAGEVAHLGIKVTAIEPGYFRTDGFSENRLQLAEPIEELQPAIAPTHNLVRSIHQRQPGDPAKAAKLIVEALTGTGRCEGLELPQRLVIGPVAYHLIGEDMDRLRASMDKWASIATTTDFDS